MSSTSYRTPLGKARGLGTAKSGTSIHIGQRVSAIALAFLSPWFVIAAALGVRDGYAGAAAFVSHPVNSVLLSLLLIAAFYHMGLGMRVIVEDYIHKKSTKQLLLIGNMFLWVGLTAVSLFAVLRITFGS
ncbi:MAG: succinate dehydrogenase, hydrophobic membrane anchor protein [Alphaproteobacteria bacterium]|nr:succinate dehydrogenase, hydrophobic membrane anchor protein [Alphaproteobacteria bacterium]